MENDEKLIIVRLIKDKYKNLLLKQIEIINIYFGIFNNCDLEYKPPP